MNFVEQEREYCDKVEDQEEEEEEEEGEEEEDDDDEETMMRRTSKLPFPSPSSSSSSSTTKYRNFLPQHHNNLWVASSDHYQQDNKKSQESSLNFSKKVEVMELSLGNDNINTTGGGSGSIEREHMFDKVVTPSDVGKLNRLVIPKQHAEKYFPLDSSSNEKGLLLNFEDRNGKPWRFRYSYWNSSQSYVMTKGWSRFVKEKKLDAGDIVSFQRGVGESGKHRLYIDWRRRPNAPDPTSFTHLQLQNQLHFPQSVRWGRLYSLPHPLSMPRLPYDQPQFHHLNHNHNHNHHYHYNQQQVTSYGNAMPTQYYLRPPPPPPPPPGGIQIGAVHQQQQQQEGGGEKGSMVIDSIPIVHGRSVGKRLRLFGVNMECPAQDDDNIPHGSTILGSLFPHLPSSHSTLPPSSSSASMPTSRQADTTHYEFSKKGKTSSLSFDLDL